MIHYQKSLLLKLDFGFNIFTLSFDGDIDSQKVNNKSPGFQQSRAPDYEKVF